MGTRPAFFLVGGNKGSDRFQPWNLGFSHEKRTTFDRRALVRARVRFRKESGQAVAWLDDLHSMHNNLGERGNRLTTWMLPGGAPYAPPGTSNDKYIGGVKIWRIDDKFVIHFYGERGIIYDPRLYSVYVEVPLANATAWYTGSWQICGDPPHHFTFQNLVKGIFPMILGTLLYHPEKLVAQDAEDQSVRAQWAVVPSHTIAMDRS